MSKAVIMTVDDEPQVLNAVERDLRRHFRSQYRIVKAGSAQQALESAQHLKERNLAVALFLVDERMPVMSGTEFLTEVRKLYPEARKVLLTAYADTRAAISGINAVGLDYYLMKPWDPPEQHLYPILDDLLGDWSASYRPPFEGIRVAGTMWSPRSHRVKDYLSRSQIPYQWIDLDADTDVRELVEQLSPGLTRLPVVFFPDGRPLIEPDILEIAERLGLQTRAHQPFYDLIVVGGGPSGLAASVYGASEGLRTILIEDDAPGGQAGSSASIENYLGFPTGISGSDLARRATTQAQRLGAEVVVPRRVQSIRREDPYRIVTLDDGTELVAYALLMATGMSVRRLDVPGIDRYTGAGVYYGTAMSEAASCNGRRSFVVGGGNSAGQAALMLARYASQVSILIRGASLRDSMSHYLITRIEEADNVDVMTRARITAMDGTRRLESITVAVGDPEESLAFQTNHVFIYIGSAPHSEIVAGLVERDEKGFILTGPDLRRRTARTGSHLQGWGLDRDPFLLETSVPGVFAAGDVRAGSTKRVASAVGEGSGVVAMIHKYLQTV